MLLSMDEKGRIYQGASHRADGLGFEDIPQVVDESDVCLENATLEASREINKTNQCLDLHNMLEKVNDAQLEMQSELVKKRERKIKSYINELTLNPDVQQALLTDGLSQNMDHSSDFNQLEVSGYGLSSDGIMGPSTKEKAIELALSQQMGEIPVTTDTAQATDLSNSAVYNVDKFEQDQYLLQTEAQKLSDQQAESIAVNPQVEYLTTPQAPVVDALPPQEADLTKSMLPATQSVPVTTLQIPQIPWGWIALGALTVFLLKK